MTGPSRPRPPLDGWLVLALGCFAAGTGCLIVTWYEVSGKALIAEQLPYFASGGLAGIALVIAGAGCLSASRSARVEARLVELLTVATEPVTLSAPGAGRLATARPATPAATADGTPVPTPDETPAAAAASVAAEGEDDSVLVAEAGTTYHAAGCRLIAGKPAAALTVRTARERGLRPCPVCH